MNAEYLHIKELLMEQKSVWENVKYIYSYKRYQNYIGTINRIANEFKKQYILDISEEFKQAEVDGELSSGFFSADEWNSLQFIKNDPENYFLFNVLQGDSEKRLQMDLDRANDRICELEHSTTFKVGKVIMFLPCKIKDFFIKR
ncbi:hypothetical protein [Clostridium sp. OF09-36]|uniref:hypothetical protein n=1 Tax=Clostridium sp. OF09-36 TaxID=2292310 RepID=UPI001FA9A2D0|nr:hypothetical protein [Clostridium sp. OF09-36]